MKTSDFDYDLPDEFIAQNPSVPRDACNLLVYDTKSDTFFHKKFYDLPEFLNSDDILVLNKSKVIPARICFKVDGFRREIFLLKKVSVDSYHVLVKPGRSFKLGKSVKIDDELIGEVTEVFADGSRILKFVLLKGLDLEKKLFVLGQMPLPPYIKHSSANFDDYQTVFAKEAGSKAAPTAGLHFTEKLIKSLKKNGVKFEEVLLHIGLGTFAPVVSEELSDHVMHFEEFEMTSEVASRLNDGKNLGRKIIAVGTTSVRVLESSYVSGKGFEPKVGSTDIFIYPGKYQWKAVDGLITNFHLPKSTLIMLVASFLEHKKVRDPVGKLLSLYEEAKSKKYRFFSFGDAMLII